MSIGVVLIMMLLIVAIGAGGGHGVSIALEWKNDRKKLRAAEEQKPELPIEFEKWDTAALKEWDTELIKGLSNDRVEEVFENMSPGERTKIRRLRNAD